MSSFEIILAILGALGFGSILGQLANEYIIRRNNRIEGYAQPIFIKRLEIYEGLYNKITEMNELLTKVIEDKQYSKDERKELISSLVFDTISYCDKHDFYLNEELTVESIAYPMGVEDIFYMSDAEKKDAIKRHDLQRRKLKKMIRECSGITKIEKLFFDIHKPKLDSDLIKYFNSLKKKHGFIEK